MDRGLFLSRADWTTRFPSRFDFRLVGKAPSRWAPNYRLTFSRALALSVRRAGPKLPRRWRLSERTARGLVAEVDRNAGA